MTKPSNPPAFPMVFPGYEILQSGEKIPEIHQKGMTLRDYFAGQALTGMMSIPNHGIPPKGITECAYMAADAMLKAREVSND